VPSTTKTITTMWQVTEVIRQWIPCHQTTEKVQCLNVLRLYSLYGQTISAGRTQMLSTGYVGDWDAVSLVTRNNCFFSIPYGQTTATQYSCSMSQVGMLNDNRKFDYRINCSFSFSFVSHSILNFSRNRSSTGWSICVQATDSVT